MFILFYSINELPSKIYANINQKINQNGIKISIKVKSKIIRLQCWTASSCCTLILAFLHWQHLMEEAQLYHIPRNMQQHWPHKVMVRMGWSETIWVIPSTGTILGHAFWLTCAWCGQAAAKAAGREAARQREQGKAGWSCGSLPVLICWPWFDSNI